MVFSKEELLSLLKMVPCWDRLSTKEVALVVGMMTASPNSLADQQNQVSAKNVHLSSVEPRRANP